MKLSLFKVGKEYKLVSLAETGDVLEFTKYGTPVYIGDVILEPVQEIEVTKQAELHLRHANPLFPTEEVIFKVQRGAYNIRCFYNIKE